MALGPRRWKIWSFGLGEVDGCFSRGLFSHGNAAGASTGDGRGCSMVVDVPLSSVFRLLSLRGSLVLHLNGRRLRRLRLRLGRRRLEELLHRLCV